MESSYLTSVLKQFRYYKHLGEKAMAQLPEDKLFWQYDPESNSIAVIVNHLAGNMLSRFTDFITTDGEKPWRNRDAEFENPFINAGEIMEQWEKGWKALFEAIERLTEPDLESIVYIRNEGHTVVEALNRQLAHYAYHVGQIVFICKMVRSTEFQSLSIPRSQSSTYNQEKFSQPQSKRHFTDEMLGDQANKDAPTI